MDVPHQFCEIGVFPPKADLRLGRQSIYNDFEIKGTSGGGGDYTKQLNLSATDA